MRMLIDIFTLIQFHSTLLVIKTSDNISCFSGEVSILSAQGK